MNAGDLAEGGLRNGSGLSIESRVEEINTVIQKVVDRIFLKKCKVGKRKEVKCMKLLNVKVNV